MRGYLAVGHFWESQSGKWDWMMSTDWASFVHVNYQFQRFFLSFCLLVYLGHKIVGFTLIKSTVGGNKRLEALLIVLCDPVAKLTKRRRFVNFLILIFNSSYHPFLSPFWYCVWYKLLLLSKYIFLLWRRLDIQKCWLTSMMLNWKLKYSKFTFLSL